MKMKRRKHFYKVRHVLNVKMDGNIYVQLKSKENYQERAQYLNASTSN